MAISAGRKSGSISNVLLLFAITRNTAMMNVVTMAMAVQYPSDSSPCLVLGLFSRLIRR